MAELLWKTRDGREISIHQMGDRHLQNTIRMLKRNLLDVPDPTHSYPCFQGEMAQACAEAEWLAAVDQYESRKDWLDIMEREASVRNLDPFNEEI
jgi:hypothetical protein